MLSLQKAARTKISIGILGVLSFLIIEGCTGKLSVPLYGSLEGESDSHITVYTDSDVKVSQDKVVSDDTTLIVISLKGKESENLTGDAIKEIFTKSMKEVTNIFMYRKQVYEAWVRKVRVVREKSE